MEEKDNNTDQEINEKRRRAYNIADFAKMCGVEPSKVRYYEKLGLPGWERDENGYRIFTEESAFVMNTFRSITSRGFTIKEALDMTKSSLPREELISHLEEKEQTFLDEIVLLKARLEWTRESLEILKARQKGEQMVRLKEVEDYYMLPASQGGDHSVAVKNGETRLGWKEYFPISRFVGVIDAKAFGAGKRVYEESGEAVKASDFERYHFPTDDTVERLHMGSCLCFYTTGGDGYTLSLQEHPEVRQILSENSLEPYGKMLYFYLMLNVVEDGDYSGVVVMPVRKIKK